MAARRLWALLAALRAGWCLLPQAGYLHPDEFFQSPEVMAGNAAGGAGAARGGRGRGTLLPKSRHRCAPVLAAVPSGGSGAASPRQRCPSGGTGREGKDGGRAEGCRWAQSCGDGSAARRPLHRVVPWHRIAE